MSVQCADCGAVAGYGRELAHRSNCPSLRPHKVMTPEEYAAMPIKGWYEGIERPFRDRYEFC